MKKLLLKRLLTCWLVTGSPSTFHNPGRIQNWSLSFSTSLPYLPARISLSSQLNLALLPHKSHASLLLSRQITLFVPLKCLSSTDSGYNTSCSPCAFWLTAYTFSSPTYRLYHLLHTMQFLVQCLAHYKISKLCILTAAYVSDSWNEEQKNSGKLSSC